MRTVKLHNVVDIMFIGQIQIGRGKFSGPLQNNRPFYTVLKLSDIAWPVVTAQYLKKIFAAAADLPIMAGCIKFDEELGKRADIFAALAQRWQFNFDDIYSIEQVFAKIAGSNFFAQHFVGCGNDANI
ncbi:MAG: hypothetical protein ACD_39C02059G0001 [uncultured bacterium]|nr:MAG: hypothetical protein ACD_39C02059G0001 [uncultured bacterium]